jgi:hypothetical protein
MGATGSGAGIFAESKGSTLELVSAWLVVTVRNKRVALLFKVKQKSNLFCFLLLLCFCFASGFRTRSTSSFSGRGNILSKKRIKKLFSSTIN